MLSQILIPIFFPNGSRNPSLPLGVDGYEAPNRCALRFGLKLPKCSSESSEDSLWLVALSLESLISMPVSLRVTSPVTLRMQMLTLGVPHGHQHY